MCCRCKYSTSLILILIISTPDVSCKHFISHGLSVEPLVLLQLYLQMLCPGNVVQEEFNFAKEESCKAPASVCFSSIASLFGFWVSKNFFKCVQTSFIYIYVKMLIWRIPSKQTPSIPTWACRSRCQAHAAPTCTHWSWLARVGGQWARLGASSPRPAHRWHTACRHVPPRCWGLCVGVGTAVVKYVWQIWGDEGCMALH